MGNVLNSSSITREISESRMEFENIKQYRKRTERNKIINETVNVENVKIKI
jgi:hypothetical protein